MRSGGREGERQERRVDGIAGHYSETRICSFVSSLCMRRGVCASFYRLKSRLRITVQMIFFRVRTRNPLAHAAPNRTPSSSSRAPSAHTRMYVRTRIPSRSCASSSVTSPCLRYSSTNLRRSFRWMVVQRSCMGRQHCSLSTPPPPPARVRLKRNLKPAVPGPAAR